MGCGTSADATAVPDNRTVFDFPVNGKGKKSYDMEQHRGQVLLIMNTASKCGLTKGGYTTATELYTKYKDQGFTVLGFPCNQFGKQEPGTEEEVQEFACTRFKADFPILQKVEVNGDNAHPLWEYLKEKQPGILGSRNIKWNFTMFLVDRNGKPVMRFGPGPSTKDVEKNLLPLLEQKPDVDWSAKQKERDEVITDFGGGIPLVVDAGEDSKDTQTSTDTEEGGQPAASSTPDDGETSQEVSAQQKEQKDYFA